MKPHDITAEKAPLMLGWLKDRGGLAIWQSTNLNYPMSWTCPVNDEHGQPKPKPYKVAADQPERIITSTDEVLVHTDHEVARFHVAVRMGRQGLQVKLTDASTAKVKKALEKAGDYAFHRFDYETQEAVIMAPDGQSLTLTQWAKEHQ